MVTSRMNQAPGKPTVLGLTAAPPGGMAYFRAVEPDAIPLLCE